MQNKLYENIEQIWISEDIFQNFLESIWREESREVGRRKVDSNFPPFGETAALLMFPSLYQKCVLISEYGTTCSIFSLLLIVPASRL